MEASCEGIHVHEINKEERLRSLNRAVAAHWLKIVELINEQLPAGMFFSNAHVLRLAQSTSERTCGYMRIAIQKRCGAIEQDKIVTVELEDQGISEVPKVSVDVRSGEEFSNKLAEIIKARAEKFVKNQSGA